ncbi:GAL3ST1 [Branchiostoma lanceolatum]|uniref:GAL3ST1 protein n=1 Tax=Branchiostoma lanceolatum TaxID=7740 RepID=A0A8K0EZB3_BRALA|nr:GAL3ST1 [Branchiostoma lanceolatum]
MSNLPCKKKLGTASTGLLIFTGVFLIVFVNLRIGRQRTATSFPSEDKSLRMVDEIQDDLDARVTEERTEDAIISDADNIHAENKYLEHNVTNAHATGSNPQCKMKKSIAFLKVHKAGSHTTACILQRFGYEHGLNFVLPKKCPSVNLGFPEGLTKDRLMKQDVDEYNMLMHHTVYDRVKFHQLMEPDTQYVAILREPLSHLKSCFFYFSMDRKTGLAAEKNPLGRYLDNPWRYEGSAKAKKRQASMTKNLQSYVLGWKDRFNQDREEVRKFISQLDSDFSLILILEYFDASLVLLRRLMCWSFYNILYDRQPRNEQKYRKPESVYTEQQLKNHRNSSWVDYQLYQHFNTSLWSKIQAAGQDFQDELEAFQQLNDDVNSYCAGRPTEKKTFPASKWNEAVEIKPEFCQDLKKERVQWDNKICQRAGAYGKDKMEKKEARFVNLKKATSSTNLKKATSSTDLKKANSSTNLKDAKSSQTTGTKTKTALLSKTEIDKFMGEVKKHFPGKDLIAAIKKSGFPAADMIPAIKQGKYTVDEIVQKLEIII